MTTLSTRAAGTRAARLGAAREVFAAPGFADASIADVVSRAVAWVVSRCRHFGGKPQPDRALLGE